MNLQFRLSRVIQRVGTQPGSEKIYQFQLAPQQQESGRIAVDGDLRLTLAGTSVAIQEGDTINISLSRQDGVQL